MLLRLHGVPKLNSFLNYTAKQHCAHTTANTDKEYVKRSKADSVTIRNAILMFYQYYR